MDPAAVRRVSIGASVVLAAAAFASGAGAAKFCSPDLGCGPEAQVAITFSRVFTGSYRHGEPFDMLTIDPAGTGETLQDAGISLRVRLWCNCGGNDLGPIAGLPPEDVVLWNSGLCEPLHPSGPTDADGWTEFHGTLPGGGCRDALYLLVDGMAAGTVPLRTNSPDALPASPGGVDASDLSFFTASLGAQCP